MKKELGKSYLKKTAILAAIVFLAGLFSTILISCPSPLQDTGDDGGGTGGDSLPSNLLVVYVSTAGDDGNDGDSPDAAKGTISEALLRVAEGGEIRIAGGTYNETLIKTGSVNILGSYNEDFSATDFSTHPTIIDGTELSGSIYSGSNGDVELRELVLRNGTAGSGGGVNFNVGSLDIVECRIIDNTATEWGGGGVNVGSCVLTITDSIINNNIASRDTDSNGGGISAGNSTLTLRNVDISYNVCNGNAGGGVFLGSSGATFTNCTFTENSGVGYGGGVNGWESTMTFNSCSFTDNEADHSGGGLSSGPEGYTTTVTDCDFTNNSPNNISGSYINGDISYTAVAPAHGNVFDTVALTGSGFGTGPGGTYSLCLETPTGGVNLQDSYIVSWSDTEIIFYIPMLPQAGDYRVQLLSSGMGPDHTPGTYPTFTLDNQYVNTSSTVDSVDPERAFPGDIVTMTGSGYCPIPGTINLSSRECEIISWSDTEIQYRIPNDMPVSRVDGYNPYVYFFDGDSQSNWNDAKIYVIPPTPVLVSNNPSAVQVEVERLDGYSRCYLLRSDSIDGTYQTVSIKHDCDSEDRYVLSDITASPQSTYYYKYQGENYGYYSAESGAIEVTTTALTIPATPAGLECNGRSSTSLFLKWDAVGSVDNYILYRSDSENGTYTVLDSSITSTTDWDGGLTPATTYWYRIQAQNSFGASDMSDALPVTTAAAPPVLNVSETTDTSISLSWNSIPDALKYYLYRSSSSGGSYSFIGQTQVGNEMYMDSDLESGSTYYYRIAAFFDTLGSEMTDWSYCTATTTGSPSPPSTPEGLSVTASTSSSITLGWDSVDSADSYKLYRSSSSEGTYTEIVDQSTRSYTDTGLDADTTYYYKVSAVNAYGTSDLSTDVSGQTDTLSPPDIPTGLTVNSTSQTTIALEWNEVAEAESYTLYRSSSETGSYGSIVTLHGDTSYTDESLTASSTYWYKVEANNSEGSSGLSTAVSGTTDDIVVTLPDAPSGLNQTGATASRITMAWNAVSGATSYSLYRSTSLNGSYTRVNTTTATSMTDYGRSSGLTYYYKVSATNESGEGDLSSAVAGTVLPQAPSGLSSDSVTEDSVDLSWNAVTGATGYYVYRSTSSSGTYTQISSSSINSYTNTGLDSSTTYYYKVAAYNAAGTGAQSSYCAATTEAGYETKEAGPIQDGTYVIVSGGQTISWIFSGSSCTYNIAGQSYSGTYTHNADGSLNASVSRTDDYGYGIIASTTIAIYYDSAFTTDSGQYLFLGAMEKTSGNVGDIPGTYTMVMNMVTTVSIGGAYPSTTTTTTNTTTTTTYASDGTYSGSAVTTGSSTSTTGLSGTWTDNGDGTITQVSTAPAATTTTYIPYWVSAYSKDFLAPESGAYVRQ